MSFATHWHKSEAVDLRPLPEKDERSKNDAIPLAEGTELSRRRPFYGIEAAVRSVLLERVHLLGEYRDNTVVVVGWVQQPDARTARTAGNTRLWAASG